MSPVEDAFSGTSTQPVRCDNRLVYIVDDAYHSDGQGDWSTDGCNMTEYNQTTDVVGCECNHLTNFACLVVKTSATSQCTIFDWFSFRTYPSE